MERCIKPLPPVVSVSFNPCTQSLLPQADTVIIRAVGDIMLHSAQIQSASMMWRGSEDTDEHKRFNFKTFLAGIEDDLKSADLCVGNMEFTLGGPPFTGYPAFSAPDSYAEYASDCGIDILLTANNHIIDRGKNGIERTLDYYREMEGLRGVRYTGTGKDSTDYYSRNPLLVRVKGFTIGIVNFTYGTNALFRDAYPRVCRQQFRDELVDAVQSSRKRGADIVVVFPHWGEEYVYKHNREQEELASLLSEAGADIIIGSHPHVVQDYGHIHTSDGRDVPVYYSLGNAVSNMSAPGTQVELMVSVRIIRNESGSVSVLDVGHDWLWCSRPGTLGDSYMVVKESDCPPRTLWQYGYEKMITEFESVKQAIR